MVIPERHALLDLTEEGRSQAWELRQNPVRSERILWECWSVIPAISTGRMAENGLLQIGFSYPIRRNGSRVRIGSYVDPKHILHICSPWETIKFAGRKEGSFDASLCAIREHAESCGLMLGVFGTAAMELITGLPYLDADSDLDLVIDRGNLENLQCFSALLQNCEHKYGICVDTEVRIHANCYCKLTEILSQQKTVLCKGRAEPFLLSRQAVLDRLAEEKNIFEKES